ncbi:MAG TPA: hypothetical protein VGJ91_20080 [Polyangiaceae bacterium]|jgi:hypothetical protein
MSASEPGRAMTAFAPFERKPSDPQIPGPPPMPTDIGQTEPSTGPPPTQLDLIEDRLSKVEDALFLPDGVLHALFAALDQKAVARHEEMMRTLTTIANGQSDLSDRLAKLEPEVERHDAQLHLLRPAE